jgi:hypothetical protein
MPVAPDGDDKYEIRITRLSIAPPSDQLFSEQCTDIELQDEAAGEFVVVRQKSVHVDVKLQEIQIDVLEWPAMKQAIDYLLSESRNH